MPDDPLSRAITEAGGPEAFRAALNISPRTLYDWRKRGVPDTRAHDVAAVAMCVSAEELACHRVALLAPHGGPRADAGGDGR